MDVKTRATIEDLYKVEGNAELVHGEMVKMPPAGDEPNVAGGHIFVRLYNYVQSTGRGRAYTDGAGFRVNLPHRESLSPDAAYHIGTRTGMDFLQGAPIFAVEVRSKYDYGPAAERAMKEKRDDYFACGTLVVWDLSRVGRGFIERRCGEGVPGKRSRQPDGLSARGYCGSRAGCTGMAHGG
jgi:Uma2 family endonuclease